MMNYIKSEIYRTIKNRNFKIMCVIFIILIVAAITLISFSAKVDTTFRYGNTRFALGNIYNQMTMFFTIAVVFSAIMDNGEGSNNTVKNSISFGISRKTIYFGKFIVQVIFSILTYIVMSALLVALSFLLLEHSNVNEIETLFRVSIGGATSLLAVLAVTHFFFMNNNNQVIGLTFPIIIMVIIPWSLNIIGRKIEIFHSIAYYLPYNLIAYDSALVEAKSGLGVCALPTVIGALWMVTFLILGIYYFNKKEVK